LSSSTAHHRCAIRQYSRKIDFITLSLTSYHQDSHRAWCFLVTGNRFGERGLTLLDPERIVSAKHTGRV
jgi:hypothetical protein